MLTRNGKASNGRKRKSAPLSNNFKKKKNTNSKKQPKVPKKAIPKKKVPLNNVKERTKKTIRNDILYSTVEEVADVFREERELFGVRDITDDFIQDFSGNTSGYQKSKEKNLDYFFDLLESHEKMSFLAHVNSKNIRHFFLLTRHKKDADTKTIINKALCLWANRLTIPKYDKSDLNKLTDKEYAEIQYEPNSFRTNEKMLWASFRMNVSN